jgi:hypothetical protein
MVDHDDNSPRVRVKSVVGILALVMALSALFFCLCGMVFLFVPLSGMEGIDGAQVSFGEGALVSSVCFIPAIILLVAAGGIWFLFGRTK